MAAAQQTFRNRPEPISFHDLIHKIVFEENTPTGYERTASWGTVISARARVRTLSGGESSAAQAIHSETTMEVTTPWRREPTTEHRINWTRYVSPRYAFTVNTTTETLTATGHIFANGDTVQVVNEDGGLPGGLSAGPSQTYYAISVSGAALKLSLTLGGSAVDITTAGTGTHYIAQSETQYLAILGIREADNNNRRWLILLCKEGTQQGN